MKLSNKNKTIDLFFSWVLPVALVVFVAFLCSRFLFQLLLIQGESMAPSYHNLQLVVLDKRRQTYAEGDVIAFHCEGFSAVLVKRIAGCPGDAVVIDGGTLLVNGQLSHTYNQEGMFENAGLLADPIKLDEDEYIVIGDNVAESKDSRYSEVGIVRAETILGRVVQ